MAVTHTEVYRRFSGRLAERRLPWLPVADAGVRTAWKRKLPVLLLFVPLGIGTITACFTVYAAFSITAPGSGAANPAQRVVVGLAQQLLNVRSIISNFNLTVASFSVLVMAWFGAGLIAEDRRRNAHLLWFARPLRRRDYVLGKLAAVGFWGAQASLLPGIVICLVAVFTSPDWVFLTEQWDTILLTVAYSLTWIVTVGSLTLAFSALLPRKTYALVAIAAWFTLTGVVAGVLIHVADDPRWAVLSPFPTFEELRLWFFAPEGKREPFAEVAPYLGATAAWCVAAWTILALRVRRLEAVA